MLDGCYIFILDQLVDDNNDCYYFLMLKDKYHLSVATHWQYLQLQHLFISQ